MLSRRRQSTTWFFSDWQSDENVRACGALARGVWIEFLGVMHKAEPRGRLLISGVKPTIPTLAQVCGLPEEEVAMGLGELIKHGVCSVDDDGVVYSRRMVREEEERKKLAQLGVSTGGKKAISNAIDAGFKAALSIEEKRERNRERMRRKREAWRREGKNSRGVSECAHAPPPSARTQRTPDVHAPPENPSSSSAKVSAPECVPTPAPYHLLFESSSRVESGSTAAPTEQARSLATLTGDERAGKSERKKALEALKLLKGSDAAGAP